MYKLSFLVLIFGAISLTGCASSKPMVGPNGKQAYFVKCGSAVIDKCYEEASKVCPNGYTFADKQANPNGVVMPMAMGFMAVRGPNTMLVECN